eukprot:921138-Pyramimonas_sp.AAC.1
MNDELSQQASRPARPPWRGKHCMAGRASAVGSAVLAGRARGVRRALVERSSEVALQTSGSQAASEGEARDLRGGLV